MAKYGRTFFAGVQGETNPYDHWRNVLSSAKLVLPGTGQLPADLLVRIRGTCASDKSASAQHAQPSNPPRSETWPNITVELAFTAVLAVEIMCDGSLWPFSDPSIEKCGYDPVEVFSCGTCNGEWNDALKGLHNFGSLTSNTLDKFAL